MERVSRKTNILNQAGWRNLGILVLRYIGNIISRVIFAIKSKIKNIVFLVNLNAKKVSF